MEFKLKRTSVWLWHHKDKTEKEMLELYELPKTYTSKAYLKELNNGSSYLFIKFDKLEDLIDFQKDVKDEIIISRDEDGLIIEIYDDYRE